MSMLTFDQVLSRICPVYHDHFRKSVWHLLRSGEDIIWAGNWSVPNYSKDVLDWWRMGYILFTTQRWIQAEYWGYPKRSGIQILQLSSSCFVPDLPSSRLTIEQLPGVSEGRFQNITAVSRQDYQIKSSGKIRTFSWLIITTGTLSKMFGDLMYYSLQDGNEVYAILQRAIHSEPNSRPQGLLDELERLTKLHTSGALTDAEFQNAKRKLGI